MLVRPRLVGQTIDEDEVRPGVEHVVDPRPALVPHVVVASDFRFDVRAVVLAHVEDGIEVGVDVDRDALAGGEVERGRRSPASEELAQEDSFSLSPWDGVAVVSCRR